MPANPLFLYTMKPRAPEFANITDDTFNVAPGQLLIMSIPCNVKYL